MSAMTFSRATRKKARLRLTITGPSGSGKTLGALMIAKGLGGRIAVIDTERGSASLYSAPVTLANGDKWQPPPFDVLELDPPYHPERFVEALHAAENAGYDIVIADSTTHEWSGVGGCLELVEKVAATKTKGNTWAAWNEVTPRHRAFVDAFTRSPCHVITTMRSKTETAQEERNGKKVVVKLGMKAEQRDGMEFEFTTVVDLVHDGHYAIASKDRTGVFAGMPRPLSEDVGRELLAWLETGEDAPSPPPPATPAHTAMPEQELVDWLTVLKDARDEDTLTASRQRAIDACSKYGDRNAAERINETTKAHRAWIRARNSEPGG
jgi:hypothetical protein